MNYCKGLLMIFYSCKDPIITYYSTVNLGNLGSQ